MFKNTLKNFKEKRDLAFFNTTSISVEYLKTDLNTALSEAIEKISEDELTKANFCRITYRLDGNGIWYRDCDAEFFNKFGGMHERYVLDDSYAEEFYSVSSTNEYKDFGPITDIYRVFQAFISELKTYPYILVDDEKDTLRLSESIYVIFDLNK